jgi:speckle-type POZ protein
MSSPWFDNYTTMTIGSCSEANKLGKGRYVKSDRFNAGGHSWRIALYPNGRLVGTTASMSRFLLLDDDNSEGGRTTAATADEDVVHVKFRFMMHEVYDRSPVFMSGTVDAAFSRRSNAHGFERFVSRNDFEKMALFKWDRFAIQCCLTIFPTGSKGTTVQMSSTVRPDPSVVQAPPPPPASPKPSVVPVPPSAPPSTPTPSVVRARMPPPGTSCLAKTIGGDGCTAACLAGAICRNVD